MQTFAVFRNNLSSMFQKVVVGTMILNADRNAINFKEDCERLGTHAPTLTWPVYETECHLAHLHQRLLQFSATTWP